MTKIFIALCTALFTLTMAANTRMSDTKSEDLGPMRSMPTPKYQDTKNNENNNLDMQKIMNDCNDTFRIEMAYLESLNETGSFSEQNDMTAKCFIRCMLENMYVMSADDGIINPARAAVLFAGNRNGKPIEDIGDMTALCAERREVCECERAYQFMSCLMSMEIEKYESNQ